MEAHHPHHVTHKKKWTEYLLEFFMLFLAVFLGFVAENIREHGVERSREKQYMRSMIKDLQQDLHNIEYALKEKQRTIAIADSLTASLLSNHLQQLRYTYYYARTFSTYKNTFYMTDGTLTQLKNSGSLRLIHHQQLVDSLQSYANVYREYELDQQVEGDHLKDYRHSAAKIFDAGVFHQMVNNSTDIIMPPTNPPLLTADKSAINEMLVLVNYIKRVKLINTIHLKKLREKANSLIKQIQKEYHLK